MPQENKCECGTDCMDNSPYCRYIIADGKLNILSATVNKDKQQAEFVVEDFNPTLSDLALTVANEILDLTGIDIDKRQEIVDQVQGIVYTALMEFEEGRKNK